MQEDINSKNIIRFSPQIVYLYRHIVELTLTQGLGQFG